jgi:peptide/nickel transport system permease protein
MTDEITQEGEKIPSPARASQGGKWARFRKDRAALFGLVLLAVIVAITIFGPFLYPTDPFAVVASPLTPPGGQGLLLGTDKIGRDLLAGIINGGRATLLVGCAAAIVAVLIGVTIGACAGYFGRMVDSTLMRITEIAMAIPVVLFAIVLLTLFSPSVFHVVLAIGLVVWPPTARVARAEFLRLREAEYVRVARTCGCGHLRIMLQQILPNALPPLIVMSSLVVGVSMLFQAGISFLGLADPNVFSWGLILGENRDKILQAWWPTTFPGIAIFLTVLSVNLIGDGLNEALNPREEGR